MTGSPLRKKISREKLEALRGEYKTTKLNGKDHNELVCYNYRPEPILRIPANQIVTVLPRKISAENSDYNILHFIDGKDLVLDYVKSTETGSGALKEEDMPSMHFALTKVKTLPESFLADFPLFGGSAPLKTFDMNEAVLRLNDRGHHNNPRVHVLLCEQSGTGRAKVFFEQVLEPFLTGLLMLQQNVDFDVHETTDPRDYMTRNLARDVLVPAANQGKKRTVIVCSGDGGIVDLLNGPLRQCARESTYVAPTICMIPLGTGNALFHSLHRPLLSSPGTLGTPLVNALRTILYGSSQPLPTFTATFSPGARVLVKESRDAVPFPRSPNPENPDLNILYGAVVASYGFHATLIADSDTTEYRKHGSARFGMVATELLDDTKGGPHLYKCRVAANFLSESDNDIKNILTDGTKEFGYIVCTLISNLEEAFTISPESKPLDGTLRTVCFGNLSGADVMKIMGLAYQGGKHIQDERITYKPIKDLRIDTEEEGSTWKWRRCCVDGQIVAIEEGGWMAITNGGIGNNLFEIMVPQV